MSKLHVATSTLATLLAISFAASTAGAVSSAELYTSKSYFYGRFVARIQFAAGDGVVSSFFLWKDGSEKSGTFWNELDFEKLGADCHLETNAYYGNPAVVHSQKSTPNSDLCNGFHTYVYEWTPEYIAWSVDGVEIRRETGAAATAYAENATAGMQIRFNIWPGDSSFGGNFSASILPVYEYVNWVEYYSYADGAFSLGWREDFDASTAPSGWLTGNWGSPKNLSTHKPGNVNFVGGYAILSLTADDALGAGAAAPQDSNTSPSTGGATGAGGTNAGGSTTNAGGAVSAGGATSSAATTQSAAGGNSTVVTAAPSSSDDGGCSLLGGTSRQHRHQPGLLAALALAAVIGRRALRRFVRVESK